MSKASLNVLSQEVVNFRGKRDMGGHSFFVREHGGETDGVVIVDGDVEELPTDTTGFVLRISGEAMARFINAGQLFDVDAQQIAGSGCS